MSILIRRHPHPHSSRLQKQKMENVYSDRVAIPNQCPTLEELPRLDPTVPKSTIFTSANLFGKLLLGLFDSNFSAFMKTFFIGPPLRGLHCEHTRRLAIGERGTDEPTGNPFFHDWVSLPGGLCLDCLAFLNSRSAASVRASKL